MLHFLLFERFHDSKTKIAEPIGMKFLPLWFNKMSYMIQYQGLLF